MAGSSLSRLENLKFLDAQAFAYGPLASLCGTAEAAVAT
jgi:hypothetical protein